MITLLVVFGHIAFIVAFGWIVLSYRQHDRNWTEALLVSVLLGMYVETLSVATLMFAGLSLMAAALTTAIVMVSVIVAALYRGGLHHPPFVVDKPKWYEWLVLVAIGEKILFAVWQLSRTHTYFEDALTHWSGRARSLFGEVNWSFDPASQVFLGGDIGSNSYPLQTVIWRALSAKLNGEWNDIISRVDGLIFFIVILGTVWMAISRFSNFRWLAAAAAFIMSAIPLHAWHAAAGYSDIAVEAFVVTALAALLRNEWFLAGIMAAGAAWSKNDGLVLYFPALLTAVVLIHGPQKTDRSNWRNVGWFLLGFTTIAPWLLFNYVHALGITAGGVTAGQSEIAWHSDAPGLLLQAVLKSNTSSILWIAVFACVIYSCNAMFKDGTGRALILAFAIILVGIVMIFSSTSAYAFLSNQITIHRTMMQFSAVAVLVVTYGLWLKIRSEAPLSADQLKPKLAKSASPRVRRRDRSHGTRRRMPHT